MPFEPAVWRPQPCLSHTIFGADQLEQLNARGGVAVVFEKLADQPVHLAFSGSQNTDFSVWSTRSQSGFTTRPKVPFDVVTIRFVTSGVMSRDVSGGREMLTRFGQALFASFDEMRLERMSPDFAAITVSVGRAALIDAYRAMEMPASAMPPRTDQVVELRTMPMVSLRNTLMAIRDQMSVGHDNGDMMTPLLQEILIYKVVSAWPTTKETKDWDRSQITDRPVKLAIDFIECNLCHAIGVADIAGAAGLSVRGLQVAFKKRMGCAPVVFLIARRLDKVHAALRANPSLAIGQIARQWGFAHMSDFARRYRMRFGHNPRVTKP